MTKAQHYVRRAYLKHWTNDGTKNGKLIVYRKKPRGTQVPIQQSSLMKVGNEKYFYDITGFTDQNLATMVYFMNHILKRFPFQIKIPKDTVDKARTERDFIEGIQCEYEQIDDNNHFLDKLISSDFSFYRNNKTDDVLVALREEMVAGILGIRNRSDKELLTMALEAVDEMTDSTIQSDLKYDFLRYFCMQYMRTPKILNAQAEKMKIGKEDPRAGHFKDLPESLYTNVLMIVFAEQLAYNLSKGFHTWIELLENDTNIPFVTADVPIVNLTGEYFQERNEFYYPLSPKYAMKLCVSYTDYRTDADKQNTKYVITDASQINYYNYRIVDNCVNEVYADNESILKDIKSRVGEESQENNYNNHIEYHDYFYSFGTKEKMMLIADFNLRDVGIEICVNPKEQNVFSFPPKSLVEKDVRGEIDIAKTMSDIYQSVKKCSDEEKAEKEKLFNKISPLDFKNKLVELGLYDKFISVVKTQRNIELINRLRMLFELDFDFLSTVQENMKN